MTSTTTTLSSTLNPSNYADTVTFLALVVSNDIPNFPGPPTGTVTFFDGAGSIGTRPLDGSGTAALNTSILDVAGSPHDITAVYNGDATFDPSTSNHVSQQVNQAPTTTTPSADAPVGTPWNQLPVTYPIGSVVFTAVVVGGGTPTGTVDFNIDGVVVFTGVLSGGRTTFSTEMTGYALGPHSVFMVYSGDSNHTGSTSGVITQTVIPNCTVRFAANPVTDISGYYGSPDWLVISWPLTNPSVVGQIVRILAWIQTSVTANGTVFYPTGKMTLREGPTVLDTQQLILGNGSNPLFSYVEFNINSLSVGTHLLSVDYEGLVVGGDTYFTPSSTDGYITGANHLDGVPQVVNPAHGGGGGSTPSTPSIDSPIPGQGQIILNSGKGKFLCPSINCPGTDEPIINVSAEAPDPIEFLCAGFGPTFPPPLNSGFSQTRGVAFGQSTASLDEACLIAQRDAINDATDGNNPWTDPAPTQYFKNAAQTCSFTCTNNGVTNTATYTTPADMFTALSQTEADALANQYACLTAQLNAQAQFGCNGAFVNQPQTCQYACPTGTIYTGTVPAGTFSAVSLSSANQLAYQYACLLAQRQAALDPNCQVTRTTNVQMYRNNAASCPVRCPSGGGTFIYTVPTNRFLAPSQIEADRMALSYACLQARKTEICLGPLPSTYCMGQPFSAQMTVTVASGNVSNVVISAGGLPDGLHMSYAPLTRALTISGIPTETGTFNFTLTAFDALGNTCSRSYSLTDTCPTLDMPLDQAVYVPAAGSHGAFIAAVRGGYLFSLDPTTGLKISSTRFRASSFSESSIAYDSVTDKLYVSCWRDPQGTIESAGNSVSPLKQIAQIDPVTFSVTLTFNPQAVFGDTIANCPFLGPKQVVAFNGIIYSCYYTETLPGATQTSGYMFSWNPVSSASVLQPGTNAIFSFGDWTDILAANATDLYVTQAYAFDRRVTYFDTATMDSQPGFVGSSVQWPAGTNPCGITRNPGTGRLYMTSRTPAVLRANTPFAAGINAAVLANITLPNANANPVRIRYNSNDGLIYVPGYGSNEVYVINPATDTVVATKTGFDSPLDCVFTPSKKFAVQHGAAGLKEIV